MKKCRCCNIEKEFAEFRPNKSKSDGHQSYCKSCDKEKQAIWYQQNKEKCKAKSKISNKKRGNECRLFLLEYLKTHPCQTCGETDPVVLEFDHVDKKTKGISQLLLNGKLEAIKKEILKCQVLCANCHKRKTAKDFNWYKLG